MRLMSGREALAELTSLVNGEDNTLVTYEARKYCKTAEPSKKLIKKARKQRIHFLIDYIHGKLPPTPKDEPGCI